MVNRVTAHGAAALYFAPMSRIGKLLPDEAISLAKRVLEIEARAVQELAPRTAQRHDRARVDVARVAEVGAALSSAALANPDTLRASWRRHWQVPAPQRFSCIQPRPVTATSG